MTILLRPHFQTAYVTSDRDRAIERFASAYGVKNWLRAGPFELKTLRGEPHQLKIAHAFVGETDIEVIEPAGGVDTLYCHALPQDRFAIRLHHHAARIHSEDEWQSLLKSGAAVGFRIAWQGSAVGTRVFYFDTYEELGQYIEFLYYFDLEKSLFYKIPHNDVPGLPPLSRVAGVSEIR